LGAYKTGSDETNDCEDGEYDYMLIAGPRERETRLHQFEKAVEGERAQNEKEGDEHRRKKYISHMHRIFSAATLLQLKSGAKVDIKKAPRKRSANSLPILPILCQSSAKVLLRMPKFCV